MSNNHGTSDLLITVIIAAYNSAAFIEPALRSALGQRGVNVEVIVVDDGSTDETANLVRGIAQSEPRLRLLQSAKSRGPSAARNFAINKARGEWIAILDSDDEMKTDRIARLVSLGKKLDCDLIADNLELVDFESRQSLGRAFDPSWMSNLAPINLNYMLLRDWPGKHSGRGIGFLKPIIKAEFLNRHYLRYDEDIIAGEDLLLYARALNAGARFFVRPEADYLYSVRPGSISSQWRATRDLAEVNSRISKLETAPQSGVNFAERGQAFWYQQFSGTVKQGKIAGTVSALRHLSPWYVGRQLIRATTRRLSTLKNHQEG